MGVAGEGVSSERGVQSVLTQKNNGPAKAKKRDAGVVKERGGERTAKSHKK